MSLGIIVRQFSFSDYELIRVEVFWVSLVGIWLLYSLFAFWVATRNWHWLLRIALLVTAAALLKVIEAEDLMLMQLFSCLIIFSVVTGWRLLGKWKGAPEHPRDWKKRFSLANLMLSVALLAFLLSIARTQVKDLVSPSYSIAFGCAVGLAFVLGIGVAKIRNRWATTVGTVLIAAPGIYNAYYWIFPRKKKSLYFYEMDPASFVWNDFESFGKAILVGMLVSGLILGYLHRGRQANYIGKLLARGGTVLVTLIILSLAAGTIDLGCRLAFRYPARPLPSQESQFDKIQPIANRFAASEIFNAYPEASDAILRKELIVYDDDFARVRAILKTPETIPLPYTKALEFSNGIYIHNNIRWIARALSTKARIEFADGQVDQSLSSSVLVIRLREPGAGNMLLVTELVSLSIEGIGYNSASESIPHASRHALAEALERVLEVDAGMSDPELIFYNDNAVWWNSENWNRRLKMLCDSRSTRELFDESILPAIRRVEATRNQVIAMLALELYRRDTENYPKKLQSLVPKYLVSVPNDPYSPAVQAVPLKYKAFDNEADYLLYSIGFNQRDDGGKNHEWGYASSSVSDSCDLNFPAGARQTLSERDAELAKQAADE